MAPRSKVWAHFSKYNENGVEKARCNYCNKELGASTANDTSTFKNHTYAWPKQNSQPNLNSSSWK